MRLKRITKKILVVLVAIVLVIGVVMAAEIAVINSSTKSYQYDLNNANRDVPAKRVGIVFGASVSFSGSLSPILRDRMNGAVDLYNRKKVIKLLLTGDNSTVDYNEVQAMRRYALVKGIPDADIVLDHAGFSTYDSCYRAYNVFGVRDAILITQQYHLPRALYTCRKIGIDAVGVGLSDFTIYPELKNPYLTREFLADTKAFWQVNVTHPGAKFSGPMEPSI